MHVHSDTAFLLAEARALVLRSAQGLSDADVTALQAVVEQQVQENMGMSMIYALVAAAQEWITEKVGLAPFRRQMPQAASVELLEGSFRVRKHQCTLSNSLPVSCWEGRKACAVGGCQNPDRTGMGGNRGWWSRVARIHAALLQLHACRCWCHHSCHIACMSHSALKPATCAGH